MNKIQELRNKRLETWEKAKTFLEDKRDEKGIVSAEDTAAYEKMEEEVVDLGKEIDRLERQRDMDMKLSEAISRPVVGNPVQDKEDKTRDMKNFFSSKGNVFHPALVKVDEFVRLRPADLHLVRHQRIKPDDFAVPVSYNLGIGIAP
jgi:HK97 family phage major capsid protein